jgi:hypothetical protein
MVAQHSYPFRQTEEDLISVRRQKAGVDAKGHIGLALSGGGIRSASFSLGVLQALAHLKLLGRFDFLSTVSGGGYVGSFWGSLFIGSEPRGGAAQEDGCTVDEVDRRLADSHSREVRWLRENGRYLSPNGSGDTLLALAVLLRNWVAVNFVLGLLVLAAFLALDAVRGAIPWPALASLKLPLEIQHSPALWLSAAAFILWALPAGWAYWLVRGKGAVRTTLGSQLLVIGALVLGVGAMLRSMRLDPLKAALSMALVAAVTVTYGLWLASGGAFSSRERRARNLLSNWLKGGLLISSTSLAVGLIDAAGWWLSHAFDSLAHAKLNLGVIGGILATAASVAQRVAGLASAGKVTRVRLPVQLVALGAAITIAGFLLTVLSAAAHAIASNGPLISASTTLSGMGWRLIAFAVTLVAAGAAGRGFAFLNQSSQASLYSARLTRAFLGATNPARSSGEGQRITEVIDGDDVPWRSYTPHTSGGPLHIINVTVNETVGGRSQVEQRDRKGMGLAIGPAGISVGVGHHARWSDNDRMKLEALTPPAEASPPAGKQWWKQLRLLLGTRKAPQAGAFRVFESPPDGGPIEPERLDLGTWIALSGAAISPGLGSRTSIGLSILCGIFNLRLGRWWNSGVDPAWRSGAAGRTGVFNSLRRGATFAFPVQAFLLNELLARFPGTARKDWYLTDGGHFENTGAYELIRRRVSLIVLVDSGEDRSYQFTDLGNLVRKARIDFDAEIEFLDDQVLARIASAVRPSFGTLDQLKGERPGLPDASRVPLNRAHAALARIRYPDGPSSLLVVLKPGLTGREPLDVLQYAVAHRDFPQQSTADQYFDEEQWESYRKLGAYIALQVFAQVADDEQRWAPRKLDPTALLLCGDQGDAR